ncbi:MAG TPA: EAL domain-containing protein [Steroidobacteraceae bacterium]|nr:EAL domain-containing protein [Steroidobacteraceae bacterium]
MSFINTFRRLLARGTEPQILFPVTAVLLLGVIWGTTFGVIRVRHTTAAQAAAASSRELLETYEAQVVRALREIDQTLNLVKYLYVPGTESQVLSTLRDQGLLPPALLFVVMIADRNGNIVDTTRPGEQVSVAGEDYFRSQREADNFHIGQLRRGRTGAAKLSFSRGLRATDGTFEGAVIVTVDADYFVSSYEASKLGAHGVLGLFAPDGVFRVRRTGDAVFSGDAIDYAATVTGAGESDAVISTNSWDGIRRWISARELYGFPLAVLVGLSVDEQMAGAYAQTRAYRWWAALGSLVLVLLSTLLGRMSWQLARSRTRESEIKLEHAKRVEYLAYHDALTGLPNRSMFSQLLAQSIGTSRRNNRTLAVAFLDLDRFKQINDTLGHDAGDQLLREVAIRLHASVREGDTVARLGGDEFVVLLPDLADETYAATVAQKILAVIAKPFTLIGQEFRVTTSIGISTCPKDGLDEQTLTKNADIAMYHAKEEGKNNFQFYSETINANSLERLTLESSLRRALEHNEFRLHYQAKRDLESGRITGMEALLRWEHPELGTVAPMQFIRIAEETGLIVAIGKWVLKTACEQNVAWRKEGLPPMSIAVNLTVLQFCDEHLLDSVTSALRSTGMDPDLLELEIAESLLTHDVDNTLRILTGLKAIGVRIAVDDFGTGYSSIATLQKFPLDTIKIDRSFIRDILSETDDRGLAHALIAMGKSLSMTVVAQGVETREQAEFLRANACDELQGFYFEKPLPAGAFTRLLHGQGSDITYTGKRLILK